MDFNLILIILVYALAIISWFGCPYIVPKKYKKATWRLAYQREMALPLLILGIGTTLRWLNISRDICVILTFVSVYLSYKANKKYGI